MSAAQGSFGELRRNWRVLPPCLAGVTLCAVHGYSMGVMIPPLEQEFGWRRAEISGGLFIISMIALFAAPLAGVAIDRFGARRIGLFGIGFFCASLAALSLTGSNVLTWWALWGLLGVASMFIIPTVWTTVINKRFDRNRGIALALALCGTGIAAAVVPSLTRVLVETQGWRGAYVGLGLIGFVVVFPLAWWLFDTRASAATAAEAAHPATDPSAGFSIAEGLRMPSFIKLAAAILLFSVAVCALTTNAYPVLLGQGLGPATAAAIAGLIGIGSIMGRLGGGLLLDRIDAAKVAAISVTMPVITVLLLLFFPGSALAAGAACVVLGLSVGAEVDCAAYLAAKHFGLRSFGTLFGALNGLMLFGNGVAPVLANHVYDVMRTYSPVLWAQIPACLITALLFLWLGPYPAQAQRRSEEPVPDLTETIPAAPA
jgi:MFS family permease